jgi:hypothetical protein
MPATGAVAVVASLLCLGFVEALGGFYPSRRTWWGLRRSRGRHGVRKIRERFEEVAALRGPRMLATLILCLLIIWVASASLLDKRWYEVAVDAGPSIIVMLAFRRIPTALTSVAERMKKLEREAGDDPDAPIEGDGGAIAIEL